MSSLEGMSMLSCRLPSRDPPKHNVNYVSNLIKYYIDIKWIDKSSFMQHNYYSKYLI